MIVSIFCDPPSWNALIADLIDPFIKNERKKDALVYFNIYFSTKKGNNVIFYIETKTPLEIVERNFSQAINDFLPDCRSIKKKATNSIDRRSNYPKSSVWFNLADIRTYEMMDPVDRSLRQQISCVILKIFNKDEIDTNAVYTLLIYLHLGMIRSLHTKLAMGRKKINALLNSFSSITNNEEKISLDMFEMLFNSNSNILVQIIGEVWNDKYLDDDSKWLNDWISACKSFISEYDFLERFYYAGNIFHQHLGMNMVLFSKSFSNTILMVFLKESGNMLSSKTIKRID